MEMALRSELATKCSPGHILFTSAITLLKLLRVPLFKRHLQIY